MGTIIKWRCAECGEGESFSCGPGMMGINAPVYVEEAKEGKLGPALSELLRRGIPEGWVVWRDLAYYLCPDCGSVSDSWKMVIDDGSGGRLVYYAALEWCPKCGRFIGAPNNLINEDALTERCERYEREGCPKCGKKAVERDIIMWD